MIDSKKEIISWSLYDWANSAFATTVMGGFFPVFFKQYWSSGFDVTKSTFFLGWSNSLASLIVAAMAPFLGAVADRSSGKKRFLMLFAFLGILSTSCLYMVNAGNWQLAAFLYILGTIGFAGGNIFYDSLIVNVASPKKVDFVSSLGFSVGYIGGGLLFLVNVLMYLHPEKFSIPDAATAIKISFLSVGVWWTIFMIPLFLFVSEPKHKDSISILKSFSKGWSQLKGTFAEIRKLKMVALFLLAYWFYIDGVDTIIRMAVDYGTSIGFPASSMITALLIVQFVAFPAALLYNIFGQKIGVKKAIMIAVSAYGIITIGGVLMNKVVHFYLLAVSIGLFQGGIQALSRSYYTRLIPKEKAAEFFGFYNMLGKFAAIIGPFLVGIVAVITGSNRLGILSIIILFAVGIVLLSKVDENEGKKLKEQL